MSNMLHCKRHLASIYLASILRPIESIVSYVRHVLMLGGATLSTAFAAEALSPLPMTKIAPGIFVHQGEHAEADRANLGAIANIGFIVGEKCVAVVDTGGSRANGERLKAAIRAQTDLPICAVINTHVHPDHIYGNAAFQQDDARFIGHARLEASMRSRQPYYAKALERALGPEEAGRSPLVAPDTTVAHRMEIDLGGRRIELQAWPTAHTDTDLTVFDAQTKTLWAGDLLFERRAPSLDGSLTGWLTVMEKLRAIPARRVIPGHGKVGTEWPSALDGQRRYLTDLRDEVRKAIRHNKTLAQTVQEASAQPSHAWILFGEYHPHNVTVAYTELEWED